MQSARPSAENQRNLEVAMAYILNKIACKHNKECLVLQLLVLFTGFDMWLGANHSTCCTGIKRPQQQGKFVLIDAHKGSHVQKVFKWSALFKVQFSAIPYQQSQGGFHGDDH